MAGSTVQFFGKENALKAYENRAIATWALFQGKQLLTSGNDAAGLSEFLDMVDGSSCIYTLKVYKSENDPDYITDKTECNGSFNFKLLAVPAGRGEAVAGMGARYSGYSNPVMDKLQGVINEEVAAAIDKRLNGGANDDKETWNDVIMGYVNDPERLVPIINAIGGFIGQFIRPGAGMGANVQLAGSIAGPQPAKRVGETPAMVEPPVGVTSEQVRMFNAITRLEKVDPDLLNTMEKLADMAENNPAKYKMAKGML